MTSFCSYTSYYFYLISIWFYNSFISICYGYYFFVFIFSFFFSISISSYYSFNSSPLFSTYCYISYSLFFISFDSFYLITYSNLLFSFSSFVSTSSLISITSLPYFNKPLINLLTFSTFSGSYLFESNKYQSIPYYLKHIQCLSLKFKNLFHTFYFCFMFIMYPLGIVPYLYLYFYRESTHLVFNPQFYKAFRITFTS